MKQAAVPVAGLLENLALQSDCMYLSDLHSPIFLPGIRRALCCISPEQFTLREWQDAVAYITGEQISIESPEQAAEYLKNYQL